MKPLFYARLPGRLLLASEIKALLVDPQAPRRPNPRGLAQFFTFGQLLAEDTLLADVTVLPPAGILTYDVGDDRLRLDSYGQAGNQEDGTRLSESQHLERIDQAFQRAVDRRVSGTQHLGISLSGGLDARTILAVIDHERIPVTSITMGMEGSIDHDSSRRLAALTNRRHHAYVLDTQFLAQFEAHLERMVYLTDGQYLSQCIVMPTLSRYRELGIEVLLRGHAGELMHMRKAYNFSLDDEALAAADEDALLHWLTRRMRAHVAETDADSVFNRETHRQMEALANDSLRACLESTAHCTPLVQRVSEVFLGQRVRRETATSMVKFGSLVETRLPYVDNELIDALRSAPPTLKLDHAIQAYVLGRRRPEFLKVANANTGAALDAGPLRRRLAKARFKVLAKLGVPGYQPYERLGLWLRRELRPLVSRLLLSPSCLERDVFDPNQVRRVVREHLDNKRNHTFLLMALLVYEVGQRTFIDGTHACGDGPGRPGEVGTLMGVS